MSILDDLANLGRASLKNKEKTYSASSPELGGIFDKPAAASLDRYLKEGTAATNAAADYNPWFGARSATEVATDGLADFATGAVNATLGGAKLAAGTGEGGIIGAFAGANEWLAGTQSDQLKAHKQDRAENMADINKQIDAAIAAGTISQSAGEMRRFSESLASNDLMTAGSTITQGLGSLASIVATRGALRKGAVGLAGAASLGEVVDKVSDEVYAKDPLGQYVLGHEQLLEGSPAYAETYAKTGNERLARDASFVAAKEDAITNPYTLAGTAVEMFGDMLLPGASKAVGKTLKELGKDSVSKGLTKTVAGGIGKAVVTNPAKAVATEMPAEVAGSIGRSVGANIAAEDQGYGERSSISGVGEEVADSVIGSLSAAGARPLITAMNVAKVGAAVTGTVAKGALDIGKAVLGKGEAAAEPSLTEKANATLNAVAPKFEAAMADVDAMPDGESKTQANTVLDQLGKALLWEDIPEGAAPESIRGALNGSANITEALDKAIIAVVSDAYSPLETANLVAFIEDTISELDNTLNSTQETQATLEDGSTLLEAIEAFKEVKDTVTNHSAVAEAISAAKTLVSKADSTIDVNKPILEQMDQVNALMAKASTAPETLDEASISYALDNAEEAGLGDSDVSRLSFIRDTLSKQRELDQVRADQGHNKPIDLVGRQVKSDIDSDTTGPSVLSHADKVMSLARAGNVEQAKAQLIKLGNFAKSQANKLNALVASQKSGQPHKYKTVAAKMNRFVDSKKPVTYSAPVFADTVQAEAEFLAFVHNQLAQAHPELGVSALPVPAKFTHGAITEKTKPTTTTTTKPKSGVERVNDIQETTQTNPEPTVEDSGVDAEAIELNKHADKLNALPPYSTKAKAGRSKKNDAIVHEWAKQLRETGLYLYELGGETDSLSENAQNLLDYVNERYEELGSLGHDMANADLPTTADEATAVTPTSSKKKGVHETTKEEEAAKFEAAEAEATAEVAKGETVQVTSKAGKVLTYTKIDGKVFNEAGREITAARITNLFNKPEAATEPVTEEVVEAVQEQVQPEVVEETTTEESTETEVDATAEPLPNLVKTVFGKLVNIVENSSLIHESVLGMRKLYDTLRGDNGANSDITKAYAGLFSKLSKANKASLAGLETLVRDKRMGAVNLTKLKGQFKTKLDELNTNKSKMGKEAYDTAIRQLRYDVARRYDAGQLLNLYEYDAATDTLTLPTEVMDAVSAAFTQYVASFENEIPRFTTLADIEKAYGIAPDSTVLVDGRHIPLAMHLMGLGVIPMTRSKKRIARQAMQMLGVRTKDDVGKGLTEGAMESLVGSLLHTLVSDNGPLEHVPVQSTKDDGKGGRTGVVIPTMRLKESYKESNTYAQTTLLPDLMSDVIIVDREKPRYIGEPPKAAKRKAKSVIGKTSKRQQDIVEYNNSIPFYMNEGMYDVHMNMLGEDNILELFGDPTANDVNSPMNMFDRIAKQGNNNQLLGAVKDLQQLAVDMQTYADENGIEKKDVPAFYSSAFTAVSRLQMQGSYTPQGNKSVRSIMSPNKSQVDLSNFISKLGSKDFSDLTDNELFYALAMAQAFGIKIHNNTHEQSFDQLADLMDGKLKPVIDMWAKRKKAGAKLTKEDTQLLKSALGGDLTNLAIQVINEYVDLSNSDGKDFTTYNYIEADGITNGPFIAGMILGADVGSADWVEFMENGGLYIGRNTNSNEHRSGEFAKGRNPDNYLATAAEGNRNLNQLLKSVAEGPAPQQFKDHAVRVSNLIGSVFGHISVDPATGEIKMSRNTSKNPMTITIYGSGVRGIAGNFADEINNFIHELSTLYLKNGSDNSEAGKTKLAAELFPHITEQAARAKLDTITNSLIAATRTKNRVITKQDGSTVYATDTARDAIGFNLNSLSDLSTLSKNQRDTLIDNLKMYLAEPLVQGAASVSGKVMENSEILARATNMHSGLAQALFAIEVQKVLTDLQDRANNSNDDVALTDLLSEKEIRDIHELVEEYDISIETLGQIFSLAKTEVGTVPGIKAKYGYSAGGRYGNETIEMDSITNLGVGGVPRAIIGFGDAATIMTFLEQMEKRGLSNKLLQVFDGINLSADNFKTGSKVANEAIMSSITADPLGRISDSITMGIPKLLIKLGLATYTLSGTLEPTELVDKGWAGIDEALGNTAVGTDVLFSIVNPFPSKEVLSPADLINVANTTIAEVREMAKVNKANQEVLKKYMMSADQMAAVGEQAVQQGEEIGSTDPMHIAFELSKQLAPKPNAEGGFKRKTIKVTSGEKTKAQAGKLLKDLMATADLDSTDVRLFNSIFKAAMDKGVRIFTGNAEEIRSDGVDFPDSAAGAYNTSNNTAYINRTSLDTFMHELTHSVTTATLVQYFTGDRKALSKEVQIAIQNLDKLLDQFMSSMTTETMEQDHFLAHYRKYIQTTMVRNFATGGQPLAKAKAISEMIAIVATNAEMREAAKLTKNNTVLKRIVGAVVNTVKAIFSLDIKDKNSGFGKNASFFEAAYLNTSILVDYSGSENTDISDTSFHVTSDTTGEITGILTRAVNKLDSLVERERALLSIGNAKATANKSADDALTAGFQLDADQVNDFQLIHTLLGAAIPLDTDTKSGIHKMVRYALKELKPESFYKTSNPSDTARYEAESKYNMVTGAMGGRDASGKSSLVPTFVALSMVNPEFKKVLSKLTIPSSIVKGKDFDGYLSQLGYTAAEALSNKLQGIHKSKDVPDNLVQLFGELLKKSEGNPSKLDTLVVPVGNMVDKANDLLSEGLSNLGSAMHSKGKAMGDGERKATRALGTLLSIAGASIDKDTAQSVAEGLTSVLNESGMPSGLKYTIREMIGRTKSSARIYDLIKPIRSFVQRHRQMYVEGTPKNIIKQFVNAPTAEQWSNLFKTMGNSDLAMLAGVHGVKGALSLISTSKGIQDRVNKLAMEVRLMEPNSYKLLLAKSDQLAEYMTTGVTGNNLLKNAVEISQLFGVKAHLNQPDQGKMVKLIDEIVTLKALQKSDLTTLRMLAAKEPKGIAYTLSFLQGQRKEEASKRNDSNTGGYKNYVPKLTKGHLMVASDANRAELISKGYTRVGDYVGSKLDSDRSKRGYYYNTLAKDRPFAQGIVQNVLLTVNGTNLETGESLNGNTVGQVEYTEDRLEAIAKLLESDNAKYGLIPTYARDGKLIGVERAIDPKYQVHLQENTNLAEMLGVWRGRQSEEYTAKQYNEVIVDELKAMYKEDDNKHEYVDILDKEYLATNPVIADAVKVMSQDVKDYARENGGKLMVRKDMVENVVGYRQLSIASIFDGITGMQPELRRAIKDGLEAMLGKKAYYYLVRSDEILRGIVGDAKQMIVVKSIIVPAINTMSNIVHLVGRGVPIKSIVKGIGSKLVEVETYSELTKRVIEIESDIVANSTNSARVKALQAERTVINETIANLSIYPLIQAGEFSSIVSVQIDNEATNLSQGKVAEYLESKVNQLNPLGQQVAKGLLVTKDTSMYQFLQKATDYGDFIAKAILFDDITKRKGGTKAEALAAITEEFINYDYLPGRVRGMLEGMGLLWFYNFKLRSVKIALSMVRENPLHALLASAIPSATPFGNIGLPLNDNVIYKAAEGSIGSSIGIGQGTRAWQLHPWINMVN